MVSIDIESKQLVVKITKLEKNQDDLTNTIFMN